MPLPAASATAKATWVSIPVSAGDATSGTSLTYSASGLPGGLSINASTGLISGTLALGDGNNGGTYTPTITASDGASSLNETLFWSVSSAISITPTDDQSNSEGDTVSVPVSASDATSGATLTYSAWGLPGGLSIDPSTGLISGVLSLGDGNNGGTYFATVTASDGTDTVSTFVNWSVSSAISITPTADQNNNEGDSVSLAVSASDATSGATMTYSASGLPPGLAIDSGTGLIFGTIALGDSNDGGPYAPVVTVSDGTDTVSAFLFWGVNSPLSVANGTGPGAGLGDDQVNTEGDSVSLQINASDATAATLSYSATGLPGGLAINASTGLISGTISLGDAATNGGTYAPVITLSDGTDSIEAPLGWTVNPALSITQTADQTSDEGQSVGVSVHASDPISGVTLTYSAVGLPPAWSSTPAPG